MTRYPRTAAFMGRVALLLAWPTLAAAESVAVVPVVPVVGEVPVSSAETVTDALLQELVARQELSVSALELAGAGKTRRRGRGPRAIGELREGKRLAERLRIPQAIAKLERGLELYRNDPSRVSDFGRVVETHLLLAEAHLRRGKEAEGREVLAALARIQPWLELDTQRYPPLFVNLWQELQAAELKKPRGALRIEGEPGRVFVNGKSLGNTPLRVTQLIVGEHHVVVRGQGGSWGQTVMVRETREVALAAQLRDSGGGLGAELAANRLTEAGRAEALDAAREINARYVLVGAIAKGEGVFELGLLLGDTASGRFSRLGPLVFDVELLSSALEANKAASELLRQMAEPAPPVEGAVKVVQTRAPIASEGSGAFEAVSFYGPPPEDATARALDPRARSSESLTARAAGRVPAPEQRVQESVDEDDGSILGAWWFWTAVGVVAVGAAGGAYFAFIYDRPVDGVAVEAVW